MCRSLSSTNDLLAAHTHIEPAKQATLRSIVINEFLLFECNNVFFLNSWFSQKI